MRVTAVLAFLTAAVVAKDTSQEICGALIYRNGHEQGVLSDVCVDMKLGAYKEMIVMARCDCELFRYVHQR